jgi:CO/xanthine dehydrogenase FAD-binding subunit
MLASDILWFFPATVKEAVKLIKKNGIILHAGGTKILESQPRSSIKGLVDVAGLHLNYIRPVGNTIHIGSGATFAEVAKYSLKKKKIAMLGSLLSHAASTPLRNRITIGGSIKDFPMWSNLYAPLLALDAKVAIVGERSGVYRLEEYAGSSLIKSKHLVVEVRVTEKKGVVCKAATFHVLRFEYPLFSLAAAFTMKGIVVRDARIFITGVKKKFARLESVENFLVGKPMTEEAIDGASQRASLTFVPDFKFSAEYKERTAKVYLNDLLHDIRQTKK